MHGMFVLFAECKEVVRFKISNWYKDWVIIHEDFLCKLLLCHLCHIKMKLLWSKTVVIDVHLSKAIEFIYIHCNMTLSVPNSQIKCKSQNQKEEKQRGAASKRKKKQRQQQCQQQTKTPNVLLQNHLNALVSRVFFGIFIRSLRLPLSVVLI